MRNMTAAALILVPCMFGLTVCDEDEKGSKGPATERSQRARSQAANPAWTRRTTYSLPRGSCTTSPLTCAPSCLRTTGSTLARAACT